MLNSNGKKGNFISTFFYCVKLSYQASKFYTIFRFAFNVLYSLGTILLAYIGKLILDNLGGIGQNSGIEKLILQLVCFFSFSIIMQVGQKMDEYVCSMHNDLLRNTVTMKIMEISSSADMEFFDSPDFYDAFEMVKNDIYSVLGVVWSMMQFVSYFISLCSAFIVIAKINVWFGIIIIVATIPTAFIGKKYAKELYFWEINHIDEERKLNYISNVVSDKMYVSDIRLYNLGGHLVNYYHSIWSDYFHKRRNMNRAKVIWNSIISSLPFIAMFFMFLWIGKNIFHGKGTIGDYSLYTGLLQTLSSSTLIFIDSVVNIYENRLKMDNIKNFSKYESKIADTGKEILDDTISIEFRDVSFQYPGTDEYVLEHVSFKIENGEHVGIVGLNGSGKSTLIKLILRFYDATSGEIFINQKSIKEYPIQEIRKHFSTFFQQYVIFAFSMKENIAMFQENVKEEEIKKALEYSDALDVFESLNYDLNTHLTKGFVENGVELSGGQRQKIALARSFYRNGSCVILDEPSAALDPEAEYKIFERMEELCTNKTAIFISHRLSNIVFADKVILMEHGKVLEQGTHKQLIDLDGRYAQLFNYQLSQYSKLEEETETKF